MTLYYLRRSSIFDYICASRADVHGNGLTTEYTESGDALLIDVGMYMYWRLSRGSIGYALQHHEQKWDRPMTAFSAGREHCAAIDMCNGRCDMALIHIRTDAWFPLRCAENAGIHNPSITMVDDATMLYITSGSHPQRQLISICDVHSNQLVRYKYDDFSPTRTQVRGGMLYALDVNTNVVHAVDCRVPTVPIVHSEVPYRVMAINAALCSEVILLHHFSGAAWYDLRACVEYDHDHTTGSRAYV